MKVIFLLDSNEFVELEPEQLQLRQVSSGQSALGYEVTVPIRDEAGKPKIIDDKMQMQTAFRPLVNYPVDLTLSPTGVSGGTTEQQEASTQSKQENKDAL